MQYVSHGVIAVCCLIAIALGAAGCGGDEPPPKQARAEPATTGAEKPKRRPEDKPQIEGLMGTLSQFAIQSGLEPRMGKFARCFANRSGDVEMIGGRIELAFRVAVDGSVKWVYPQRSTIGDRQTEKCILDVASKVEFRDPTGGEAEFTWPLQFDPPSDVRPATTWDPGRVTEVIDDKSETLLDACRPDGEAEFTVTAYVSPGGQVLAAGAAVEDPESKDALDCVAEQVRGWEMPDPGSYPAKVTFALK